MKWLQETRQYVTILFYSVLSFFPPLSLPYLFPSVLSEISCRAEYYSPASFSHPSFLYRVLATKGGGTLCKYETNGVTHREMILCEEKQIRWNSILSVLDRCCWKTWDLFEEIKERGDVLCLGLRIKESVGFCYRPRLVLFSSGRLAMNGEGFE